MKNKLRSAAKKNGMSRLRGNAYYKIWAGVHKGIPAVLILCLKKEQGCGLNPRPCPKEKIGDVYVFNTRVCPYKGRAKRKARRGIPFLHNARFAGKIAKNTE